MEKPVTDWSAAMADLLEFKENGQTGPLSLTITRNEGRWSITMLDTAPGLSGTFFGQGVSLDEALIDMCDARLRVPLSGAEVASVTTSSDMQRLPRRFRVIDGDGGEG